MEAMNGGMRNICELSLNVVMLNRPKVLTMVEVIHHVERHLLSAYTQNINGLT